MGYKDKEQQKQADRVRQQRRRDAKKAKGVTIEPSIAEFDKVAEMYGKPLNFGLPDCACGHCQQARVNGSKNTINHGAWKSASQLGKHELNRVTLPGDVDYDGVCNDSKYDSHRIAKTA